MKHTTKLLTLAFMLATILTLTGCPGPVNTVTPCTHENKKTVTTAATCTEKGLEKIICADCGEVIEEKEIAIDPDNHNFGEEWVVTKEATCTEKGSKKHTCTRCEEEETADIDALGHSWVDSIITNATCETAGEKTHTCSVCGDNDNGKHITIPALGHDYQGGYCEREGCTDPWEHSHTKDIRVYTSETAFRNDYGSSANTINATQEVHYETVHFSFEKEVSNVKMPLDTLLHLKSDYSGYKVKKFGINGNSFDYTDPNKEVTLTYLSALLIEPITNE